MDLWLLEKNTHSLMIFSFSVQNEKVLRNGKLITAVSAQLGRLSLVLETVKNCIAVLEGKVCILYLDASISSLPKQSSFL